MLWGRLWWDRALWGRGGTPGPGGERRMLQCARLGREPEGKAEYAATGVDSTDITAGATYTFKAE